MDDQRKTKNMKFWTFKKTASRDQKVGTFDALVWEVNTLAKVSLVPFIDRSSLYRPIIESELMDAWDSLVTIAMAGVSAQANGLLLDPSGREELKKALDEKLSGGAVGFDDYYEYTILRTKKTGTPLCGVSAMWVADNIRLHSKANAALKENARQLDFVNPISAFMNMSFGSPEVGLSHFLGVMALDTEKSMGIDMGLGTEGTKKDPVKKVVILAEIFELFARKTVDMIAEDRK